MRNKKLWKQFLAATMCAMLAFSTPVLAAGVDEAAKDGQYIEEFTQSETLGDANKADESVDLLETEELTEGAETEGDVLVAADVKPTLKTSGVVWETGNVEIEYNDGEGKYAPENLTKVEVIDVESGYEYNIEWNEEGKKVIVSMGMAGAPSGNWFPINTHGVYGLKVNMYYQSDVEEMVPLDFTIDARAQGKFRLLKNLVMYLMEQKI